MGCALFGAEEVAKRKESHVNPCSRSDTGERRVCTYVLLLLIPSGAQVCTQTATGFLPPELLLTLGGAKRMGSTGGKKS